MLVYTNRFMILLLAGSGDKIIHRTVIILSFNYEMYDTD